jgi:hypothetical protein
MKLSYLLFLVVGLCTAQPELHHFEISSDLIWYDASGYEIIYDSGERTYVSDYSYMDKEKIVIDDVSYAYDSNKIELDGVVYKFRKPLFEKATYLTDLTNDKTLLMFMTSAEDRNAYQKYRNENWLNISVQNRKVLLEWARNKQAEYAHDLSYGTSSDCD